MNTNWARHLINNVYADKLIRSLNSGYDINQNIAPTFTHRSRCDNIRFASFTKAITLLNENKPIEFVIAKSNKPLIIIKHQNAVEIDVCTSKIEKLGFSYFCIRFNTNNRIGFNQDKDFCEVGVLLPFSFSETNNQACAAIAEN